MNTAVLDRTLVSIPPRDRLKKRVKRLLPIGLGLAIALGAAWYGYDWWRTGRFIESTDDAYVGGDVTVISPKVSGLIAQVAVTDNQAVHAGDLLVRLDDRDYQASLAKAESQQTRERRGQVLFVGGRLGDDDMQRVDRAGQRHVEHAQRLARSRGAWRGPAYPRGSGGCLRQWNPGCRRRFRLPTY